MKKKGQGHGDGRGGNGATGKNGHDTEKTRYRCRSAGCEMRGTADMMFNLPCNPGRVTEEELLEKVLCHACASSVASLAGKEPRDKGSGVFPLSRTFELRRRLNHRRSERQKELDDYRRWVEESNYRRTIRDYAIRYAQAEVSELFGDGSLAGSLPLPRTSAAPDGSLCCGLPIECCGHHRPTRRFLTVFGEVVGICDRAASVFIDVFREHEETEGFRRLLSTSDLEMARHIAAKWLGIGRSGAGG
ncbi:hypothetical protein AMJ57_00760 [Parcubacteria bacterium SG8_24]|nr:MAG: hypothetical protein AMJ57_00760 [Parcubacteria bacterium SG8_24]